MEKFYIIIQDSSLGSSFRKFSDINKARVEASARAHVHKGSIFTVFESVASCKVSETVWTEHVKILAEPPPF